MYQPPKQPSLWTEFWTLTRIVYGILLWPLLGLLAVVLAVVGTFVLFTVHPALVLLPIAAVAVLVAAFAWWEKRHVHPPEV